MKHIYFAGCSGVTLVAGLICLPAAAQAQSPPAAPREALAEAPAPTVAAVQPPAGDGTTTGATAVGVDDIIVTAQRRSERVQDVPISIVALSGDSLVKSGVTTLDGIQRLASGLTTTTVGSGFVSYTFIRGGGTNNVDPGSDPSVAYFVDEIYIGGTQGLQFDLFDVDHVEVLKGPQGTLFGRNAASGAISVITKRPTTDFHGEAHLEYGDYNALLEKASLSGPLNSAKTLLFRVSESYRRHDAFGQNLNGKADPGNIDAGGARAQLEYRGDRLSVLLSADFFKARNGQTNQVETTSNVAANVNPALPVLPDQTFYNRYFDFIGFENQDVYNVSGRIELQTPIGLLTSISAYRNNSFRRNQDNDGTNYDGQQQFYTEKDRTFSQELRLVGDASDRLHYVVGAFYYHATTDFSFAARFGTAYPIPFLRTLRLSDTSTYGTDSYAAFGQVTLDLTRRLSVTAGGRYTEDHKTDNRSVNYFGTVYAVDPSARFHDFTPAVTVNYKPSANVLAYASYREGFKSGGWQTLGPATPAIANTPFLPEYVKSYEVGVKTTFLDRRVVANVALFRSDITNQQVTRITPPTGNSPAVTQIDNAGRTRADGIDAALTLRPIPELVFSANLTYQHARFLQYVTNNISLAGNQQTRSPDFSGYFSAQYTLPLGGFGSLALLGEYTERSRIYFDPANSQAAGLNQPAYGIGNLRLTLTPARLPLDVAIFVRNVGKTQYYQNIVVTPPSGIGATGDPRTYGFALNYRF